MPLTHIEFRLSKKDHFLKKDFAEMVVKALVDSGFETVAEEFEGKIKRGKKADVIYQTAKEYIVIDGITADHLHDDLGALACGLDPSLKKRLEEKEVEEKNEAQKQLERSKFVPLYETIEKGSKTIAEDIMGGRCPDPTPEETIKALMYYANTGQRVPESLLEMSAPHDDDVCLAILHHFPDEGKYGGKRQGSCPSGPIRPANLHEETREMMFERRPKAMLNIEGIYREYILEYLGKDGNAIKYVDNQDEEMCLVAVTKSPNALDDCTVITEKIVRKAMDQSDSAFIALLGAVGSRRLTLDDETVLMLLRLLCEKQSFRSGYSGFGRHSYSVDTEGAKSFAKRFSPHSHAWTETVVDACKDIDFKKYNAHAGLSVLRQFLNPVEMNRSLFKKFAKVMPKDAIDRNEATLADIRQIVLANPELIAIVPEEKQDEEMCLAAVEHRGTLLRNCAVRNQEILKAAVAQNADAFNHLREGEQTKEICLIVAEKRGYLYDQFDYLDDEVRRACIKSTPRIITCLPKTTKEERLLAIDTEPSVVKDMENPSKNEISAALAGQFSLVSEVPSLREKDAVAAIERGAFNTTYLNKIEKWQLVTPRIMVALFRAIDDKVINRFEIFDFLGNLPRTDEGRAYALETVSLAGELLEAIRMTKDQEMCLKAIMNNPDAIVFVPKAFKKSLC